MLDLNSPFYNQNRLLLALNALQCLSLPMMYLTEKNDAMPYSKFASSSKDKKDKMVPSKQGMLIIYGPAVVVAMMYIAFTASGILSGYDMNIASWMLLTHFSKRTLEVLFLHKFSGSTVLAVAKQIGFAYAFQTLLICCTANSNIDQATSLLGQSLFAIGILGNLYHHYLLACLRSEGSFKDVKKKYVAPHGGFFEYVAAPHYLFELIGWLGIAVVSAQITAYLVLGGMAMYLSARSSNQNAWNREKFTEKDWPASRKNLIPFVY